MAHNLTQANAATDEAVQTVKAIFAEKGLPTTAVVINVLYVEGDVEWAVGSAIPELANPDTASMLAGSLNQSAEEVTDA